MEDCDNLWHVFPLSILSYNLALIKSHEWFIIIVKSLHSSNGINVFWCVIDWTISKATYRFFKIFTKCFYTLYGLGAKNNNFYAQNCIKTNKCDGHPHLFLEFTIPWGSSMLEINMLVWFVVLKLIATFSFDKVQHLHSLTIQPTFLLMDM